MFLYCRSASAFPFWEVLPSRARVSAAGLILVAALCAGEFARADASKNGVKTDQVDTEHILGFTEGSDIGAAGETELVVDSTGRFGKLRGVYRDFATAFEAKRTLADNFRVSAAATLAYYDISGFMRGFDDRRNGAFQSVSFSARYHPLDRQRAPFGLSLAVEPRWGFVDDLTGARADQFSAEFLALVDRELVPGRLFGAFNMSFVPEQTRLHATGGTTRQSTLGLGTAATMQAMSGVFMGAEVRYLRHYDGLVLTHQSGQALYVGPTLSAKLGNHSFVSAAWNMQIWGTAVRGSGALDLVNFDRHRVKVRMGYEF